MSTSIDTSFGALFDGALLAFVVYGITCSQVLKYFINYPQDSRSTKLLVAVIWMLDTLHRCITIHCLWFYLVSKGNGNLLLLQRANWCLLSRANRPFPNVPRQRTGDRYHIGRMLLRHADMDLYVHIFYGRRRRSDPSLKLAERRMYPGSSSYQYLLVLVRTLPSCNSVLAQTHPSISVWYRLHYQSISLSSVLRCAQRTVARHLVQRDTRFRGCLGITRPLHNAVYSRKTILPVFVRVFSLWLYISCVLYEVHATNRKGGIIRTLLAYTLTTGVLASTFAVVVLIVYLVMPLNMVYIGVYEVYGTLFFSAMLTSLNSRKSLRAAARRDIILSPHNTDSNNPPSGVIVYTETQKHVSTV
ncbi:hypothetical protein HETIRDRAFT_383555 [Heterobasidion irregulare TC 32-1]|uniref:DUF6534 domain-containing protein n=1 Tax=Heterobasidion irregulare (strain TC 32-1) TaxID=747525 RepID=W4KC92_HETIT|nr:uncharacterized protein HETIRDRAFT_383555 [Heterobasidion irregulare TC 32-1]ETW83487.1 hypothetical protein HETIRDRAFT_383555 [Heterobasidion irregulare TC 32-1]